MALVLTDGSAAAAKALDLGTVPGLLLDHDKQQLIIVHGWRDTKDLTQLTAVSGSIDHIAKSRVAGTTLNYKLEMIKLPSAPEGSPVSANGDNLLAPTGGAGSGSNLAASPTAAAPPAPPSPAKGAPAAGAKKVVEEASLPTAPATSTGNSPTAVDPVDKLANYVGERAQHFHLKNIVLGVGSGVQGKGLLVGSVARRILSNYRATHNLYYLKQSGPIVRPAAAMRINVLIIPGSDLSHLRYALSIAQPEKKNDRVGVTIVLNNGKPKPQEGVLSVAHAQDESGAPAPGDVAKECAQILAARGLVDTPSDDATSAVADSFPLISYLALDPVSGNPTPKVDEVPNQCVKFFGAMKLDFVALPPIREGLGEAFVLAFLSAQKPHVLLVA
jgi:hypothetical protein